MWKVEGEGEEGMVLGVEIARVPRRRFERWWPSPELEDPLGMRLENFETEECHSLNVGVTWGSAYAMR